MSLKDNSFFIKFFHKRLVKTEGFFSILGYIARTAILIAEDNDCKG